MYYGWYSPQYYNESLMWISTNVDQHIYLASIRFGTLKYIYLASIRFGTLKYICNKASISQRYWGSYLTPKVLVLCSSLPHPNFIPEELWTLQNLCMGCKESMAQVAFAISLEKEPERLSTYSFSLSCEIWYQNWMVWIWQARHDGSLEVGRGNDFVSSLGLRANHARLVALSWVILCWCSRLTALRLIGPYPNSPNSMHCILLFKWPVLTFRYLIIIYIITNTDR
jgi:hypothetical protein